MVVSAEEAAPSSVVMLGKNERLVLAGTVHSRTNPTDVKKLYIKETAENINRATNLSKGEERACNAIIPHVMAAVSTAAKKNAPSEPQ
jgi:hypothetical protein